MNAPVHILISTCAILFLLMASRVESQIPGKSILLNGQNDYVEIADHNSLDIAQNLTIEAWINPCSFSDYNAIVTKQWCNNSQLSYYFGLRNGYLEWAWDDDGECSFSSIYRASSKQVTLHKWVHAAVVHSSSGVALYLDGQQVSGNLIQGSHSPIRISNSPVRIGVYRNQSGAYAEFFDGRIDDVRIWRAALQQAAIFNRKNLVLSGSETNLVSFYPMEDSGTGQGKSVANTVFLSPVADGITVGTLVSPSFVSTSVNFDQLSLGNDTTLYIGESILLSAGSSGLQFSWQNGSIDSTFSVSAPGVYWVDAFIGDCRVRDSIVVSYHSQTAPCGLKEASIYGDPELDERGYCLVATPQKDGIYVAGTKNDSTLLVRFDLNGNVIWSKTFDIIPNVKETPASILLDSEGMLAIAGVAGVAPGNVTGYIFRYDPLAHVVLWSKHYRHSEREYFSSIIQKGSGGNYIVVGTHSQPIENHDDADVLEIDKNNGTIIPAFTKGFTLWGTEGLYEIVYDGQFLYATGRYKDKGPFTLEMRNTITKLDPNNGNPLWVRLGHKLPDQSARLYGAHLVVDGDRIISGYHGDPNGHSTTNTKVFFQLTDLDGNFRWIKQYEIPGNNDLCYAVTKSGNGYVFLLGQKTSPSGLQLVKIDANGQVQWAKRIVLPDFISEVDGGGGNLKLIEVGDQLFLTANGINASGKSDLMLIRTDLNGVSNVPCVSTTDLQVTAIDVLGAVFYEVVANEFSVSLNVSSAGTTPVDNTLKPREECIVTDTLFDAIEATICQGQSFAGYTDPGVYEDYFITADGCDSSRTLTLTVLPPLHTFINSTICDGESFLGYTTAGTYIDTFTTIDGCDSMRTLFLDVGLPSVFPVVSFCEGSSFENYDESGFYVDTIPGVIGCDTVRYLTLIETPAFQNIVDVTICSGTDYSGYEVEGIYTDTFQTALGCDSIRVLQLTVDIPSIYPEATICSGGEFESYTESGLYTDTIHGAPNTCDTLRHLTLIVSPPLVTTVDQVICEGQSYEGYSVTGFYTDTLQSVDGCDSIRILQLSVMSEIKINKDIQICLGDMYDGYVEDGIFLDTLLSTFGCDSIIQLKLTIVPEEKFINVNVCEGGSFEHYSLPGQYIDTIQGTTTACDTIRHITLVVLPAEKTNISYTICAEDHFNGHSEPGEYSDTLRAADGCITIQTVLLSVGEPITSYTEVSLCDGSVQGHHGSGIIIDTLISSLGCDSIRTLSIEGPAKYIPNVFSPNNDGHNDLFEVFTSPGSQLGLHYFAIFDRFGDMTYETSAWPVIWDGKKLNGRPHQSGVYAYVLIYQCGDERIIEHGNITLVK